MSVTYRRLRTAVLAAALLAAALLASQTPAHAGTVPGSPPPGYCQTHPWLTDCGGPIDG
jgi:Spy/CpxP family protein refolding chaperone